MNFFRNYLAAPLGLELKGLGNGAAASWTAVALHRFRDRDPPSQSARGLAHSKTSRTGGSSAVIPFRHFSALLAIAPTVTQADLVIIPDTQPQAVLAGEARRVEVMFRNPGSEPAKADLHTRLFQTTTATTVLVREDAWKPLRVLPGQTISEIATLDFPAVRAETRFLVQWLDGTNALLGKTEVRVFPTNLLANLRTLASEKPLGVFDPADRLKPLLRPLAVPFQDLAEDGTDKFTGRLAVFGPFDSKQQMRARLARDIRSLAKRGVAVVWLQPPPPERAPLKPSFYTVRVGDGTVVVAQASLVARLAENPEAQLNLLRLAELALRPATFDLPDTESVSEESRQTRQQAFGVPRSRGSGNLPPEGGTPNPNRQTHPETSN
jgi:hypothetical protein